MAVMTAVMKTNVDAMMAVVAVVKGGVNKMKGVSVMAVMASVVQAMVAVMSIAMMAVVPVMVAVMGVVRGMVA